MGWSSTCPKEQGSFKYIAMKLWLQKSSKRKHKTTQWPYDNLTEQPCKPRLVKGTHKASFEVRCDPWDRNLSKCCSSLKHSHFQFTNPKELPEIKKCLVGPKASNQTLTPLQERYRLCFKWEWLDGEGKNTKKCFDEFLWTWKILSLAIKSQRRLWMVIVQLYKVIYLPDQYFVNCLLNCPLLKLKIYRHL